MHDEFNPCHPVERQRAKPLSAHDRSKARTKAMSADSLLEVLGQRIGTLQQSGRPEEKRELADMREARAAAAELMAVVQEFLDMPLLPAAFEERVASALNRAWEFSNQRR
jgi:hypothetical protein